MTQAAIDLLTPAEAGRILGITPAAVVAMEARGALRAMRTVTGRRLFLRSDVEELAKRRGARNVESR